MATKSTALVVTLAISIAVAMILLFVGSVVDKNWLPMIMLAPMLFLPIMLVLFGGNGDNTMSFQDQDAKQQAQISFSYCIAGAFLSMLLGLPLVLYHNEALEPTGFGMWLAATAVSTLGILIYMFGDNWKCCGGGGAQY